MFQKLVRERPALQEYWKELLEKGAIGTAKGNIELLRRPCGDRTLIVRDFENDILFHSITGRLDVTRAASTVPNKYSFRVRKMGDLDPDDLDPAFDKYEGFETALRDLYRAVDTIIEEHVKESPPEQRVERWLRSSGNRLFLIGATAYAILTLTALFIR
ncbi:hypothetical protein Hena1_00220 [Erwinia phage Hena1]|uniref:Uncharacterized protein n=1 Tax=Erwinia phage Hena1 TaxID=2678601 RepID=A0A6B9J628_9CAUD|nr:virion structural protein [Erwinia phage Hena1]QGZ16198.1 hypothetical protein Hena1_00220 [Erwinia phage Hena1]